MCQPAKRRLSTSSERRVFNFVFFWSALSVRRLIHYIAQPMTQSVDTEMVNIRYHLKPSSWYYAMFWPCLTVEFNSNKFEKHTRGQIYSDSLRKAVYTRVFSGFKWFRIRSSHKRFRIQTLRSTWADLAASASIAPCSYARKPIKLPLA
jgi:hypothetical protein